jgi:hypothetical protein
MDDPLEQEQPAQAVVPVFEGESVSELEGKLPAVVMAMDEGYARGTVLRLQVEVHVRNVCATRRTARGELVRQHVFALDLSSWWPPTGRKRPETTSAAPRAPCPPKHPRRPKSFGRTGQLWGQAS